METIRTQGALVISLLPAPEGFPPLEVVEEEVMEPELLLLGFEKGHWGLAFTSQSRSEQTNRAFTWLRKVLWQRPEEA